jgi:uncharacterized protein
MVRISVKVIPKSSESRVTGRGPGGELKVKVHAAPDGGAANQELQRVLGDFFSCAPGRCSIVRGAAQRRKVVELQTVNQEQLQERLQCLT